MRNSFGHAVGYASSASSASKGFVRTALPRYLISVAVAIALGLTNVAVAQQNVLELQQAVVLALQHQPQIDALRAQEQAVLETARAERELPDPKLAFGWQNVPVSGADAWRLDRDEMTMLSVGVIQDVVTRRKREASSARLTAEAARLAAQREFTRRDIQRAAALAWLDVFEAKQRAATLRKLLQQMTAERNVSAGRLASGAESASAILGVDAAISTTRDQLIVAERDEMRARAELSRWIGEQALSPLPARLPHPNETAVFAVDALADHPALLAAEHGIEVALHEVDRARAERRPDWSWQVMYGQRQELDDMVSFQVTVGLPLNRVDRQDRRIADKLATAAAARNEKTDRQRVLESALAAARADLHASASRLQEHDEHLLPAAQTRLITAEAAYAGGSGQLAEVWTARRALLDVALHHQMILADRMRALVQLAWLLGDHASSATTALLAPRGTAP